MNTFVLADLAESADWVSAEALPLLTRIGPQSGIWTGRIEERIVAICGVTALQPHVAEVWTFLHPDARRCPCWLFRATKEILQTYVEACGFWRVQALTEETEGARNWLEHLGFNLESRMPMAGPKGETLLRYVWFPKGLEG